MMRDTKLEANKDEMVMQRAVVADVVSGSPNTNATRMGWTCPEIVGATTDTWWEHSCTMHQPRKFTDASGVSVTDCKGFLGHTMTVNASKKVMTRHIDASEREGETSYRIVDTGSNMRETDDESVIAVKQIPYAWSFPEEYQRWVQGVLAGTGECLRAEDQRYHHPCLKIVTACYTLVGLDVRSDEIKDVSYDDLWSAMLKSIREPEGFSSALAPLALFVRESCSAR